MIALFKKKIKPFLLKTDIHSHILPQVDDGSSSFDESIKIIKKFIETGFEEMVLTPHVMFDGFKNSSDNIKKIFNDFKRNIVKFNIKIDLFIAAEYYLDEGFKKLIDSNDILTFGNNYLLFETSYISKPLELEDVIFEMLSKGYNPVLAHPERYSYFENLNDFKKLKDMGVLFQANTNSFSGYYGKAAMKNFKLLAKNKMIDFLATDAHRERDILNVRKVLQNKTFIKLIEKNNILNEKIFANQPQISQISTESIGS